MQITKDMTIGDLVQSYPSVVEILMDEGVHCVGCGAAYFETIEQGLMGHGKSPEEVELIVKQLNEAIPKEEGSQETLLVTETAASKLKELMKEEKEGTFLRISVLKGGCSGQQYEFALDDVKKADDNIFEIMGIKFAVNNESLPQLKGSRVDYLDSLTGAGFKVSNPNAHSTCGCGQSFN
ncbi:MAG TPA: iron-sulfur cluster assembly accessory protein [Candidatus Nanoarchaeia archaeon]|nr:iron-sulfur cluster assembly accessory protein [Candidatus Nanoarchaeia archaeon]